MLDDDLSTAADAYWVEGDVAKHTIRITSETAQSVIVGFHTWDSRSAPRDCFAGTGYNYWNSSKLGSGGWSLGSRYASTIEMEAGETIEVDVQLDFNNENLARDWSVTAWGDSGPLTVEHSTGIQSAQLPVAPPAGSTPDDGGDDGTDDGGDDGTDGGDGGDDGTDGGDDGTDEGGDDGTDEGGDDGTDEGGDDGTDEGGDDTCVCEEAECPSIEER